MEVIPKDHQERHAAEKIDLNKPVTVVHITTCHCSPTHPAQNPRRRRAQALLQTHNIHINRHATGYPIAVSSHAGNFKLAGQAAKSIKSLMTVSSTFAGL